METNGLPRGTSVAPGSSPMIAFIGFKCMDVFDLFAREF